MQLRQPRFLLGADTFDLADHLTVRHESLLRSSEATYDLTRITPTLKRFRYVPLAWIIAASIFAVFAGYGVTEGWLTGRTGSATGFFMMAGISSLFWGFAWKNYRDIFVFYDRFTNEPAFTIWRTSPSAEQVKTFIAAQ